MRLILYSAAIAALFVLVGWRVSVMQSEIRDAHDRIAELNCVHYVFEDGSAYHLDAEVALECLHRRLGKPYAFEVAPEEQ
jgi:hypothetical protein